MGVERHPRTGEPLVHVEHRDEWRAWLAEYHGTADGVWVVTWRRPTGRPAPEYEALVEEALCFGWVDSTTGRLDDERRMQRFSPRRPGSGWARTNKARVERLVATGAMAPAGQRVVDDAKADGSWTLLDDVEDLVVPPDLAAALDARPPAREHWDAFPASVRRAALVRIVQAKRPATRERRITDVAERARRGERPDAPASA